MASWDDVRSIALDLPETSERLSYGHPSWRVRDKGFVWERPLRAADLDVLGERAPAGPILGARVEHLVAKQALLEDAPSVYFTTSHFANTAAVLVRLEPIALAELEEVVVEAWLARAPARAAEAFLAQRAQRGND